MRDEGTLHKLKQATGYEWEQISSLYLWYRMRCSPVNQFCVYTPDNLGSCMPEAIRYFIPSDCNDLYDPARFFQRWLNGGGSYFSTMVELDVLPDKPFAYEMQRGLLVLGKIKFFGTITLTRKGGRYFNFEVENFKQMSFEAKIEALKFLNSSVEAAVDISPGKAVFNLDIKSGSKNNNYSASLTMDPPSIKASVAVPPLEFNRGAWDLALDMSASLEATIVKQGGEMTGLSQKNRANLVWGRLKDAGEALMAVSGISAVSIFSGDLIVAGAAALV